MADQPKTTKKKTKSKARKRKSTKFMLVWVTETEPVQDENGQDIPGTGRTCYVEMDLPPGLDDAGKRSRDAIKRACKRAVYEEGLIEFGNKDLAVISRDDIFAINYERVTVTQLLPPEKAEKVRQENGKNVVTATEDEEDEEDGTYDDEDSDEVEDSDEAEEAAEATGAPESDSKPATTTA